MDLKRLAAALADALLAGPQDTLAVQERCVSALGRRPSWLASLLRKIDSRLGAPWSASVRDALIETIRNHPPLTRAASRGQSFTVRHFFTPPTVMGQPPLALAQCVLPSFDNVGELARWLELDADELLWLARSRAAVHSEHYAYRWLEKRSGGWRLLEMPKTRLRAIQRRLLHDLLDYVPAHEAAHGFRAGHSILSHAQLHVGQRVVLKMDLEDFFLGIRGARIEAIFTTLGYPLAVARALTALCTHAVPAQDLPCDGIPPHEATMSWRMRKRYAARHLPQGAPTSPALANLSAFNLDLRLEAAADSFKARYSRYADDLTFSGGAELLRGVDRLVALVGAIASNEGMAVNFRKTRVMGSGQRQQVTGVVVNRHPNLRRDHYDRLKATLHNCVRRGPCVENRADHVNFRAHLSGQVAHVMMINPARGAKLKALLEAITWDP